MLFRSEQELSSVRTSVVTATAPALPHAPAFSGNTFDLTLSDGGPSIGTQGHHYYLPPVIQPQQFPVQSPYVGFQFQMNPRCITFEGLTPFMSFATPAPPGYNFTGGGINFMDPLLVTTTGFYDDFSMHGPGQGFASGAAVAYHQDRKSVV